MQDLHKKSKKKFLLQIHLIFATKYRRNIIKSKLKDDLVNIFREIEQTSRFVIKEMETNNNHIHFLIDYEPKISVSSIVRKLKQISTIKIWALHKNYLSHFYWKEHTFWSDGFFVCSIGNANEETIKKYIQEQG